MNQYKRGISTIFCVLLITSSVASAIEQQPQFASVSPLMAQLDDSGSSAAAAPVATTQAAPIKDPLEKMNRKIFSFNDALDTHVLVPVSKTYNKIMPKPLARGIYNFFANINNFPTITNDVLQGNFYQATSDSWRFIVNSTAGVGGLFDVAKNMGLESNTEDFGLTLARWGYTDSDYLVLPFFGPSTVRDTLGMPVDYYFFSLYHYVPDSRTRYTLYALNIVSKRAQLLQYQDLYNQIALDRYAFIRNAYLQQRTSAIERNQQLSDPYFKLTS